MSFRPNSRGGRRRRSGGVGGSQNANDGTGSRVRGPNSALTSFLQELGVNANEIRLNAERRQAEIEAAAIEEQERVNEEEGEGEAQVDSSNGDHQEVVAGNGDNDDDDQDMVEITINTRRSSRRLSGKAPQNGMSEIAGTSGTSKGKTKKRKKAKPDSDYENNNDDGNDDEGDDFNDKPGTNNGLGHGLNKSSARKGGKIYLCDMCGTRFLCRENTSGQHRVNQRMLCIPCKRSVEKANNQNKDSSTTAAGKSANRGGRGTAGSGLKRPRRKLKKTVEGLLELDTGLPSLQELCIRQVGKHIHDISGFGDITENSINKVCKIICKMRELTNETVKLFLNENRTHVRLYDCTKLDGVGLRMVAQFSPAASELQLNFCGQMRDNDLLYYARIMPNLEVVKLHGPFLVSDDEGFVKFFEILGPRLKEFSIGAARFGPTAMEGLVRYCTNLKKLEIADCPEVGDDCIKLLAAGSLDNQNKDDSEPTSSSSLSSSSPLVRDGKDSTLSKSKGKEKAVDTSTTTGDDDNTNNKSNSDDNKFENGTNGVILTPLNNLKSLEIKHNGKPITTPTLIKVLETIGSGLTTLAISQSKNIDDVLLTDGVLACCPRLTKFFLEGCPKVSSEACATFFSLWREKRATYNSGLRAQNHGALDTNINQMVVASSSSRDRLNDLPSSPYPEGLISLSFKRCTSFSDDVIIQLVLHSGNTLEYLNLHSLDENISERGLMALAGISLPAVIYDDDLLDILEEEHEKEQEGEELPEPFDEDSDIVKYKMKELRIQKEDEEQRKAKELSLPGCPRLEYLNVSFVRAVTDEVLDKIVKHCPHLKVIEVWGCSKVSAYTPKREGLKYIGRESDTL
ncbi:UV-damaged DNA-binding protein rad7 [Mycoemilia scoparia]|uniref:UV-damaged DNA-binding protein rad7 n=1 Tax=Mycoemilia scoparia TaxID=417184 RepID=A0A9W8DU50_9FUNG|nr:UV-damaged DNA-binding protein rad7 [Mycoemilia scoparia]